MGTDSDLQDMLLDGEMNIDFLEGENCDLREENKRLREENERLNKESYANVVKLMTSGHDALTDREKQAEERGAREMAQVVCDECKRFQDTGESQTILMEELMGLWRARRDKWVKI